MPFDDQFHYRRVAGLLPRRLTWPCLIYPSSRESLENAAWNMIKPVAELDGWFKTNPGESLTCTTGAGSTTGIQLVYDVQ
jgi:hypothetical protein